LWCWIRIWKKLQIELLWWKISDAVIPALWGIIIPPFSPDCLAVICNPFISRRKSRISGCCWALNGLWKGTNCFFSSGN
jgi:hypothetical protein